MGDGLTFSTDTDKVLQPPVKPIRKDTINYTVSEGDSYSALAVRYNSTVADIQKASGTTGTDLKIEQKLRIPIYDKNEWAEYQKQDSLYLDARHKQQEAEQAAKAAKVKAKNVEMAKKAVEQIKNTGHKEYVLFMDEDKQGNPTGNVIIILADDVQVATLKSDLGITTPGVLYANNAKLFDEEIGMEEIPGSSVKSYDMATAKQGMELIIPGSEINP